MSFENNKSIKEIKEKLLIQRNELAKNVHIAKTIELMEDLNEMFVSGVFHKYGISKISIKVTDNKDLDDLFEYDCFDKNNEKISKYSNKGNWNLPSLMLRNIFQKLNTVNILNLNSDLAKGKEFVLNVKKEIGKDFADIFLSKEIKEFLENKKTNKKKLF